MELLFPFTPNAFGRENAYPSSYYTDVIGGSEPSLQGKTLYIL